MQVLASRSERERERERERENLQDSNFAYRF